MTGSAPLQSMGGVSNRSGEARRKLQLKSHDLSAMRLALALGRRGLGQCWPNPSVGVVIAATDSGRIISCGWTGRGGRPHAEAVALAAAGEAAHGATAYTTLEPCSHWGKTPPCADALLASGIARLVYGTVDPDPRVAGKGLDRLRANGVEVVQGPLADEARWLALGHSLRVSAARPFIQLKLALDAGGMVPAGDGAPQWVTGEEARAHGHLLRAEADAILVGSGTVRADDPELSCRLPGLSGRSPVRVVLSSNGILPVGAKLRRAAVQSPVWVICPAEAAAELSAEGEPDGILYIPAEQTGPDGRPDIRAAMRALAGRGITRLLVEGGPTIAAALLRADLIDEAILFHGARRAEGGAIRPFGARGIEALTGHKSFRLHGERRIGADRLAVYRRAEWG
jgi:diaminohydroxyphosphoribosylaminopyrimidine deaminase/5-amino-6-(5-phosphoribosylamino)uracil reductase